MGGFETIEAGGATGRLYTAGKMALGTPGVVVFHPWWGLNDDVLAYADRLAGAGFAVMAPDMFGGKVATTVEGAEQLAKSAEEQAINAIALATVDRLAGQVGPKAKLGALGFSFGAHWAMWCPAQRDGLVCSILYYGTTGGPILSGAKVPVLGHFAEDDPYETADWVAWANSKRLRTLRRSAEEQISILLSRVLRSAYTPASRDRLSNAVRSPRRRSAPLIARS